MSTDDEALPPLPRAAMRETYQGDVYDWFTINQMRAYARAALAQRQQVPASSEVTEAAQRLLTKLETPVVALEGVVWLVASEIAALRSALTAAPQAAEPQERKA